MSVGTAKEDFDNAGEPCKVFDCVLNPNIIKKLQKDKGSLELFT